jgi:polysaccharide biosynthesis/export protein
MKRLLLATLILSLLMSSCTSRRSFVYLNELADSATSTTLEIFETPIHPNDILSINVTALNPEDMNILNGVLGNSPNSAIPGYVVDKDGFIRITYIGTVKVGGLSLMQAENLVMDRLKKYTKDPVVNIRFQNHKVTLLGDVGASEIPMTTERLTIFEALGRAGDLKPTARRDNILVVREINGKRVFGRLDLTSAQVFQSPYFYLKNNDLVYVEPVKSAYAGRDNRARSTIGIITSLIGVGLSIFAFTR